MPEPTKKDETETENALPPPEQKIPQDGGTEKGKVTLSMADQEVAWLEKHSAF